MVVNGIWLYTSVGGGVLPVSKNIQELRKKYPFLSPRILTEYQNDVLVNFLPLREKLRQLTEPYGESFAFYFEYLPSGTSIGVNEKGETYAASLIKVPVVMAHFKELEAKSGEADRDRILTLMPEDIDDGFGTLWKKGPGTKITMEEAVRLALEESDNTAVLAIARVTEQKYFDEVYKGLDIDIRQIGEETVINAKNYASILKALYFSAVLSKESSQIILEHMTKSEFSDKLPAGVPSEIPVSHKIGVYRKSDIFSDCGIVYIPKRPYILCMFSRSTEEEARSRMRGLSAIVYKYVSTINKE